MQNAVCVRLKESKLCLNFLLLLGHEVRCIIVIENWSRWMLNFPVVYTQYGDFQYGFHEREIFPAHREIVVAVNELDSITGSSGTIAWELVSGDNCFS